MIQNRFLTKIYFDCASIKGAMQLILFYQGFIFTHVNETDGQVQCKIKQNLFSVAIEEEINQRNSFYTSPRIEL